jgi:hypothetical protein
MPGQTSPDIPAYCCYLLVLSVGMMVAAGSINKLLIDTPTRWAFLDTWILFFANAAAPVLLFWFLDYTGVVRDTSFFSAVVIAFGYQQVFAGGVQGILMPGQSSKIWQPFEAWVNKVALRIAKANQLAGERKFERARRLVLMNTDGLQSLQKLVFLHTKDVPKLTTELAALAALPQPNGASAAEQQDLTNQRLARKLLEELRSAKPEDYGFYLEDGGILYKRGPWSWVRFSFLLGKARSRLVSGTMLSMILLLVVAGVVTFLKSEDCQRQYHQWRFLKLNASELDRFRSQEFLEKALKENSLEHKTNAVAEFQKIYSPILKPLRSGEVPLKEVDAIQHFVFYSRVPGADEVLVPGLIEALETDNLEVRTRIQQLLTEIQKASYTNAPTNAQPPDWQPAKEDTPHKVVEKQDEWRHWWQMAKSTPAATKAN